MTLQQLHYKITAAKKFLNREVVRIRTEAGHPALSFREIGDRLDMIHEAERIGIRNLDERDMRIITRMLTQLDEVHVSSLN